MKSFPAFFGVFALLTILFTSCQSPQVEPVAAPSQGTIETSATSAFGYSLNPPTVAPLSATINEGFSTTLPPFTGSAFVILNSYTVTGLPTGLVFNASSRTISGTPTQAGSFTLTYSARGILEPVPVSTRIILKVVSEPVEVTGNFEGYLDIASCEKLQGWVYNRDKPNAHIPIEFLDGNTLATATVIGTMVADIYRSDLQAAGKGNGEHLFIFTTPLVLKDGIQHTIWVRVKNSSYVLKWSPKPLTCVGN